jgi:hypothetical protein
VADLANKNMRIKSFLLEEKKYPRGLKAGDLLTAVQ